MKQFYNIFNNKKVSTLSTQLSWSHYNELLPIKDENEMIYYFNLCINQCIDVRCLGEKIRNKEYKRLPINTRNKLTTEEKVEVKDLIKNPILIRNKNDIEAVTEKALHQLILEDIESFMKELSNLFCFVGSEYKIKIGNTYNYLDILLLNIEFNCYVVVELKVTELKKEHIGQIQVYMNYVDDNISKVNQDKTIGIIICKEDNKYIIKYSSDDRIIARKYELV